MAGSLGEMLTILCPFSLSSFFVNSVGAVWGFGSDSSSGEKGFSVCEYLQRERCGSGFGSRKTVLAVAVSSSGSVPGPSCQILCGLLHFLVRFFENFCEGVGET